MHYNIHQCQHGNWTVRKSPWQPLVTSTSLLPQRPSWWDTFYRRKATSNVSVDVILYVCLVEKTGDKVSWHFCEGRPWERNNPSDFGVIRIWIRIQGFFFMDAYSTNCILLIFTGCHQQPSWLRRGICSLNAVNFTVILLHRLLLYMHDVMNQPTNQSDTHILNMHK